jgi:hypothetical protein
MSEDDENDKGTGDDAMTVPPAAGAANAGVPAAAAPAAAAPNASKVGGPGAPAAPHGAPNLPVEFQVSGFQNAPTASPSDAVQKSGKEISGLQREGVVLAKWLLVIIAVALSVLTLLVTVTELGNPPEAAQFQTLVVELQKKETALAVDSPQREALRKDVQDIIKELADMKQSRRAFWVQFSQMILLNLLLPVLTAILGYVFGTSSVKES